MKTEGSFVERGSFYQRETIPAGAPQVAVQLPIRATTRIFANALC